jgi:hypothetical protein
MTNMTIRSTRSRLVRSGLMVTVALVASTTLIGVQAAGATSPPPTGSAVIANGSGPLPSGGSADQFTLTLPSGAACPADSATGGFQVYSYLVPQSTDLSTLNFKGGHPSTGLGLFITGTYYHANTAVGSPALVYNIPSTFTFDAVFKKTTLSTLLNGGSVGVWELGLACGDTNNGGALSNYWNTEVTFTASTSDPDGFVWSDTPGAATPEVPYALVLPVLGAAIIGGAVLIRRRRSAGSPVVGTPAG